jgi:uncharacterized membrane protein YeiH
MYANDLHWPIALDLLGIFTASCSGALTGIRKGLDLVGVLVLAALTGLGGGVIRDLMIGATPPALLTDWRYLTTATVAAVAVLAVEQRMTGDVLAQRGEWLRRRLGAPAGLGNRVRLGAAYLTADAATLGCFAVSGTAKALQYHIQPMPAALMGVTTAVGGGVIRDILVNEVPTVLRRELYALPALVGALIIVLAGQVSHDLTPVAYLAAVVTAVLRLLALRFDWHLQLPEHRNGRDASGGADEVS